MKCTKCTIVHVKFSSENRWIRWLRIFFCTLVSCLTNAVCSVIQASTSYFTDKVVDTCLRVCAFHAAFEITQDVFLLFYLDHIIFEECEMMATTLMDYNHRYITLIRGFFHPVTTLLNLLQTAFFYHLLDSPVLRCVWSLWFWAFFYKVVLWPKRRPLSGR